MHWIIIAIAAICAIVTLIKHIPMFLKLALYSPIVNSIIYIILAIFVVPKNYPASLILIILVIIDCIRDIKIWKNFYNYHDADFVYGRDKLFNLKSLLGIGFILPTWILTRSLPLALLISMIPRGIFLIIVYPFISLLIMMGIRKKMQAGYPLNCNIGKTSLYIPESSILISQMFEKPKAYYYDKHVYMLWRKGKLKLNVVIRENEFNISKKKFIGPSPKSKLIKFYNKISHKDLYNELAAVIHIKRFTPAYLSTKFYKKYPQRIGTVMLTKGTVSPWKIKEFEELKDLNLTIPLENDNSWSEPFIIEALEELVAEGIIEDLNLSDEVQINHTYRHVESKVEMKSIDLSDFLDDDNL